jgi:hypothetical protein
MWTHFMQHHLGPGVGGLPSCLATGETAADDVNGLVRHVAEVYAAS